MAASSAPLSFIFKPKPFHYLFAAQKSIAPLYTPIRIFPSTQIPVKTIPCYLKSPEAPKCWKISASNGVFSLSEASPVESSQELVSTSNDGVSNVISALLFVAFVGLSILTIGVIYIAVTDFLQKREGDKFQKEEAAKKKKKKSGKKGNVRARARAGPRGFGKLKIDEDDFVDEAD
ncbi:hypothetical protein CASFOL_002865 [Castilleja foliolosa]|uniref:Transmembrane protein n=1 Tax=Castilleja foliolosa TaxID=1961234 RepID=A0ABD3EIX3_9LAMI